MKVFIAGPRAVSFLDENVQHRLTNIVNKGLQVLIGDASGVDRLIQKHLLSSQYPDVNVYASNGKARNNLGDWPVVNVDASGLRGFEFFAIKDLRMAEDADYGFMIWNGISKGTLTNIVNLNRLNKKAVVYFLPNKRFYTVASEPDVLSLVHLCSPDTINLYKNIVSKMPNNIDVSIAKQHFT